MHNKVTVKREQINREVFLAITILNMQWTIGNSRPSEAHIIKYQVHFGNMKPSTAAFLKLHPTKLREKYSSLSQCTNFRESKKVSPRRLKSSGRILHRGSGVKACGEGWMLICPCFGRGFTRNSAKQSHRQSSHSVGQHETRELSHQSQCNLFTC